MSAATSRGTYASVPEQIAAIERFVAGHNELAAPLVWTKPADRILAKAVQRKDNFRYGALEREFPMERTAAFKRRGDQQMSARPQ